MPRPKINKESERLRRMVHQHLSRRASLTPGLAAGAHLDEDALSAFVEGRLGQTESAPVIRHLVGCSTCRHITAQLIRLDTELPDDEMKAPLPAQEPSRIRSLLADLASRVLPSSETDVVFAYHAPADDFEKKDKGDGKSVDEENEHGQEAKKTDT
jgi:hypothetical protein